VSNSTLFEDFWSVIQVEVLVLEGAMLSSVAITIDALETANRLRLNAGRSSPFVVRLSGAGAGGFRRFMPTGSVATAGRPDLVIVPGAGLANATAVREGLERPDAVRARKRLVEAATQGAELASACSSTFLLASTGLLDGRRATTTWWLAPLFRSLFPVVRLETESLVVTDGPITTAGAAMAQMDLMLFLIARHSNPELADSCARYLLLDERRSQSPYMAVAFLAAGDERIARAQAWARKRLAAGIGVEELSAAAGLTPRTFARRVVRVTGLSPVRFLQRLRVERAVELTETTRLPFEEIARRVGYTEPSTLRRLIRLECGARPRELRRIRPAVNRSERTR
jgi:transcriptional regulator GlxA family with amidase domain